MPILKYRLNKNSPWNSIMAIKGDPFTYEDLTPEQIESLRGPQGDPFTYEDFTAAQLEALRGPKGADGTMTFADLTEEQKAGLKGDPGTSATHSWNGTVLTITSASGTSSADLQGPAGSYTLTSADKEEIAGLVMAQLPACEEVAY